MISVAPAHTSSTERPVRLIAVSLDGTMAGGLRSSRETVVSVLPTLISERQNVVRIGVNGVGAGISPFDRFWGGLCGWGTQRNVITAYKSVAKLYQPGDIIILSGYSRGAWAARYLALIISAVGLPKHGGNNQFFQLLYRECDKNPDFESDIAQELSRYDRYTDVEIEALCCFDTVGSLGLPLFGIARPLALFRWGKKKEDMVSTVAKNVKYAFHCLSLHETREPFGPTYMSGTNVHQVYFLGNHGDLGWIDSRERFSHAALAWMIQQLYLHSSIVFDDDRLKQYFRSYHPDMTPASGSYAEGQGSLAEAVVPTSEHKSERCYPWATGRITRTSTAILAVIGKRVRQPWNVAHTQTLFNRCGPGCLGLSDSGESTRAGTTTDTATPSTIPDVQVHIGAREYRESNAVPGYTIRLPVEGQFYWEKQGCAQQPPRGTWLGKLRSRSCNSSSSQEPIDHAVIRSERLACLPGSQTGNCQDRVSHRINEAPVGSLEARLLGLPAEVVSTRPCCLGLVEQESRKETQS